MVNYYRDMWQKHSHILAPLTGMVSKVATWKWGKEQQQAFKEMKRVISQETLLTFPDFEKPFHIYTDASNYQLGAVIMQNDKPLAFYSRKLNSAQKNYTTGEQELLSIVETLKEFRNILWGQEIIVHTDHINIVYGKLSNERITRWRLLLEEFGPQYVHVRGKDNVVADVLSRMEANFDEVQSPPEICACALTALESNEAFKMSKKKKNIAKLSDDKTLIEAEVFPLAPNVIEQYQRNDKELSKLRSKQVSHWSTKVIEDNTLALYKNKIFIPKPLRDRIVTWYHAYLSHPGQTRMERTLAQTIYWPKMADTINQHVKTCRVCQKTKGPRKLYGKLPPKQIPPVTPWNRVDVDLIGPLTVKTKNSTRQLRALTMIDPATGWFEIKDITNPTAKETMEAFDDTWLCRYPRPEYLGFDGGSEFKAIFDQMRTNYGLKKARSTPHNPQSNGIVERVHQVLNNCLRAYELEDTELNEKDPWTPFLAAAAFAIRSTYHTVMAATPGQLVFGRDMILPLTFKADWARIQLLKQQETNKNNERENKKRLPHKYNVGDQVLITYPGLQRKLKKKRDGPYPILRVFDNGTLRIRRGAIEETINIRRVTPYFD